MRFLICENYEEMSREAAKLIASQIKEKKNSVLGLATGSTPVGMYRVLAEMTKKKEISFKNVTSFNLDEYYPLDADNPQSYHYFMKENLFSKIDINPENTYLLDGTAENTEQECKNYEQLIADKGGIDLQVLGIGQNGHIGFNEPDATLNSETHLTNLTENTIEANSRFFDNIEKVPKKALTMGMGTILKARKIILLANGEAKHNIVSELLNGDISTDVPASMLKLHSDVILICDKSAFFDKDKFQK